MKKGLFVLLILGLVFVQPQSVVGGDNPPTDNVRIEGPVKVAWEAWFDGPGWSAEIANASALSPDGSILFVTGSEQTPSNQNFLTVAVEAATGERLWATRYDGPASLQDVPHALAVSPDGLSVFVTGFTHATGRRYDCAYATIAYDAVSGKQIWSALYDEPVSEWNAGRALAVSPDGSTVFVTGDSGFYQRDFATVAYDAASGERIWSKMYDGPAHGWDCPRATTVSPDGLTVFVIGESVGMDTRTDFATMAYDTRTGETIWSARFERPGADIPYAVATSPDGSIVFVTGDTGDTQFDIGTVAYDAATGDQIWSARYDGPASLDDVARSLTVSPDGSRIYVTGASSADNHDCDYVTIAYDSETGEELWAVRAGGLDRRPYTANSVVTSPDGSVLFVTGGSVGRFATVAYDSATGNQLWIARYAGPYNHGATSIAVGPDGSEVYVSGSAILSDNYDYVTVALFHGGAERIGR